MTEFVVVLVTVGSRREGETIARQLVEEKVAACVNLLGPLRSTYWWQGAVEEAEEYLLVIKSRAGLLPALAERVRELHSYEVPEVLAVPVLGGSEPYLAWLRDCTVEPGTR